MAMMRSLYRSICLRSLCSSSAASAAAAADTAAAYTQNHRNLRHGLRHFHLSPSSLTSSPKRLSFDRRPPFLMAIGSIRSLSEDVAHMPDIKDPEVLFVFKDLMAASWDEIPDAVIHDAKKALSKNTDDKAGQEALKNVFCAAEAVEEFGGKLVSLRMEIDDTLGLSGENVKEMPEEYVNALRTVYQRYTAYLDAFGPDEAYLRKKVETELGTKLIHLKLRCSGLGAEWGKVTVLGTSGLSGSYVEQRA